MNDVTAVSKISPVGGLIAAAATYDDRQGPIDLTSANKRIRSETCHSRGPLSVSPTSGQDSSGHNYVNQRPITRESGGSRVAAEYASLFRRYPTKLSITLSLPGHTLAAQRSVPVLQKRRVTRP